MRTTPDGQTIHSKRWAHDLDYGDRKVVHWLRMGSEAGFNAATGAATTKKLLDARGKGRLFVRPSKRLVDLGRAPRRTAA